MPDNIVDVDAFTDPIQAPADGEDASEPTIQLAPQGLANRTRNLKNRLDTIESSGNIVMQAGKSIDATDANSLEVGNGSTKTTITSVGAIVVAGGSNILVTGGGNIQSQTGKVQAGAGFDHVTPQTVVAMAAGVVVGGGFSVPSPGVGSDIGVIAIGENDPSNGTLKIPVPHLATITRIRVLANLSTTPSAVSMELQFRRIRHDKVSPFGVGSFSNLWIVSKSTSGDTLLDSNSDGTFAQFQIDRSQDTFECSVVGGEDGGNTCDNRIKWIELTYTMPGPVER